MRSLKGIVFCVLAGSIILLSGCYSSSTVSSGAVGEESISDDITEITASEKTQTTTSGTESVETVPTESADSVYKSDYKLVAGKKFQYAVTEWRGSGTPVLYWTIDVIKNNKTMQTFKYQWEDGSNTGGYPDISDLVVEKDANFDGYSDLLIFMGHFGAQGFEQYQCYLWNKSSQKYTYFKDFENIPNPKLDSRKKRILGTVEDNAFTHTDRLYEYVNGSLLEIGELEEEWQQDGSMKYTEYKLVNKEMKLIHEVHVKNFEDAYWNDDYWSLGSDHWKWIQDIKY